MSSRQARAHHRRTAMLASAAAMVIAVVVVVAVALVGRVDHRGETAASDEEVTAAIGAGPGLSPVCGFPDVGQITADGDEQGDTGLDVVAEDVTPADDRQILDFEVVRAAAYVLSFDGASTYRVDRYDLADGSADGGFEVPLELEEGAESFWVGDFQVDADGNVYLLDTLMGRRDLVRLDPEGNRVWTTELPPSDQTAGRLLDLYGTVLWQDADGEPVIGVHEGASVMHRVAHDGTVLGTDDAFPGGVVGQIDDASVILTDDEEHASAWSLDILGRAQDGSPTLALGATTVPGGLGHGGQYTPGSLDGAVSGPGGLGLLVAKSDFGFEWFTTEGVRRGVWLAARGDLDTPVTVDAGAGIVRSDGAYYVLADNEGGKSLVRVSEARMAYQLAAPVKYNAGTDSFLSVMGIGLGLETGVELGYFAAGTPPQVSLTVDDAWAPTADGYAVRYHVTGDPRLSDPVAPEEHEVALPAGGQVSLELPDARPGVYEVDAHLVQSSTGEAVSGTCLRYTVGADGADLALEDMADGAGWGGASALRGVQLADALGFGSHRVQLDFGRLVADPGAEPTAAGLDWSSLPSAGVLAPDGSAPADPFTELRRAGELADELEVRLIAQLGSGGEAERAAVQAGTWEGWVRQIVAEFRRSAPTISTWEPWNEPNNTGFDDGTAYVRDVAEPFARGARAADPQVLIVGGNSLGVALDWWSQVVDADGCDSMDVVGIHPYTGLNRSWEEEGFSMPGRELDALRDVLAPCPKMPWWDTETGWWSDGVVNFWSGGADVARRLLWYRLEDLEEWTYFFSEGGWGETGNSWSAIQHDAYVKPLGAAAAATTHLLDDFEDLDLQEAPMPGAYAVAGTGSGGELLALWTDDFPTTLELAATGGAEVELVDQYGARQMLAVPADGVEIPVSGAPTFVVAPSGTTLTARAAEAFGADVLEGRPVTATSTHEDADASVVTSGTFDVRDPWRSGQLPDGSVDDAPALTIETEDPVEIDRIAVATAGIRCCTAGLRDYSVEVRDADGNWSVVATVADQLYDRAALLQFEPVTITAVRVSVAMTTERDVPVLALNYSGVVGGPHPSFMALETESDHQVAISAVRAWGPA